MTGWWRQKGSNCQLPSQSCRTSLSVIGFDTMERSLLDVSEDIARELRQRCSDPDRRLPGQRASGQYEHVARIPRTRTREGSGRRSLASRNRCRAALGHAR
jgi:hypothetical protein